jgi:uncharacterized protein YukE
VGDSWIGGDITGLHTMGSTLTGAKEQLESVVKPLSSGVETLVTDAGWKSEAAEEFRGRWIEDAMAAGGFAELVKAAGDALTTLAQALTDANSALQNAADVAQGKGVPVGPHGVPGTIMESDPQSPGAKQARADLDEYDTVYREITTQAQKARLDCAKTLTSLYDTIDPKGPPLTKGDKVVIADYLRGLWTVPSEKSRRLGLDAAGKLSQAEKEHDAAYAAMKDEEAKFRTAEANLPKAFKLKGEYQRLGSEIDALHGDILRAENGSSVLPYDKVLNYKLADALKGSRLVEGAPEFLRELPVVDVAAAAAFGGLEAKEDHDKGWSWGHSVAVDVGGALVGLGVGAAVVAGGVEVAEAAGVAVSTGAEVAAGGAVILFTSDVVDEAFHEHWSEDIHDHGVVAGIGHGTANVFSHAGKDFWDTGTGAVKSVGNTGKKLWHSVF